jgi:arsenate reductase
MITIYHNSRCKKSRAGLEALENFTSEFELRQYLKDDPFTVETLTEALRKLGKKPEEMIRKQEAVFKSDYKGKIYSDTEWIMIMVENPKLIHRPIIIKDDKAILGDPAENISQLF